MCIKIFTIQLPIIASTSLWGHNHADLCDNHGPSFQYDFTMAVCISKLGSLEHSMDMNSYRMSSFRSRHFYSTSWLEDHAGGHTPFIFVAMWVMHSSISLSVISPPGPIISIWICAFISGYTSPQMQEK